MQHEQTSRSRTRLSAFVRPLPSVLAPVRIACSTAGEQREKLRLRKRGECRVKDCRAAIWTCIEWRDLVRTYAAYWTLPVGADWAYVPLFGQVRDKM